MLKILKSFDAFSISKKIAYFDNFRQNDHSWKLTNSSKKCKKLKKVKSLEDFRFIVCRL